MFTENPIKAIKNYQTVGVESGVAAADPHQLILMLFEGARQALDYSHLYIQQNKIAAKGEMLSKAITIIEHGLKASLDKSVGGELAIRLDQLYEYMSNRLLTANLKNDVTIIEEVNRLLGELQEAWISIKKQPDNKINKQTETAETGTTV